MAEIIAVQGFAGAGKTTHSEYVRLNYTYKGMPIEHVSIGNRLRAILKGVESSQYAALLADLKASGLTDELATNVVFERINQIQEGIVLMDGFPREEGGVATFGEAVYQGGHKFLGTVALLLSREASIARLRARGVRKGENLRKGSLKEEAEWRYDQDIHRLGPATRALGRIASVQTIDANGAMGEVREGFLGGIRGLGVELTPRFQQKAAEYVIDPLGNTG